MLSQITFGRSRIASPSYSREGTKPKRRRAIDTVTKKVSKAKKQQPNRMKTTKGPIERNPVHTDLFLSPHLLFIFLSPQLWFKKGSQKSDDPLSPLCSLSSVCHSSLESTFLPFLFHTSDARKARRSLTLSEDWAHASTPEWRQGPDERAKTRKRRKEGRVRRPGECRSVEHNHETKRREEWKQKQEKMRADSKTRKLIWREKAAASVDVRVSMEQDNPERKKTRA